MTRREGVRLLLIVAAALAAAFAFDIATHPEETHAPRHFEAYTEARGQLPVLGAVRVRSDRADAAHRLKSSSHGRFAAVLDPSRAEAVFAYGRLLYATPDEVEEVLDALGRGEPPRALPEPADVRAAFRDRRGPFACDVILRDRGGLDRIREVLPGAELSGELLAREREEEAGRNLPRALLMGLFLAWGWIAWRGGSDLAERRLLAALVPLAILGVAGWGVDRWTVIAVVLVVAAPDGPSLLCAIPCLFFPALTLRRMGFVFLCGTLLRLRRPGNAGRSRGRNAARVLVALLLAAGALLLHLHEPVIRLPGHLQREPAATFVDPTETRQAAEELRARGFTTVIGEKEIVPADPDRRTRWALSKIFRLATRLGKTAPEEQRARFRETARAASLDSLYLPAPLRARLRTRDGRAVLWVQEEASVADPDFVSAETYRLRGERQLRRDAGIAACIALVLGGLLLARRHGEGTIVPLTLGFLAIGLCGSLLHLAGLAGADSAVETLLPLLVVAALSPSLACVLALAGVGLGMPVTLGMPAAAAALCALVARLSRPSR
jgi:hypothetical protein